MRSSRAAISSGRRTRGRLRGRLGDGMRSAGFWATAPCSRSARYSARSAASLRATVAATARRSDNVAAYPRSVRGVTCAGSRSWAPHQSANWPTSIAYARRVFAAAPRRRGVRRPGGGGGAGGGGGGRAPLAGGGGGLGGAGRILDRRGAVLH